MKYYIGYVVVCVLAFVFIFGLMAFATYQSVKASTDECNLITEYTGLITKVETLSGCMVKTDFGWKTGREYLQYRAFKAMKEGKDNGR